MIDDAELLRWWEEHARKNPVYAGVLPANGGGDLEIEYRRIAEEWLLPKLVRLHPEMRVLEVGCGAGRWIAFFAARVGQIKGIDYSSEMVRLARSRIAALRLTNACVEQQSAHAIEDSLPYELLYFSSIGQGLNDASLDQLIARAAGLLAPKGQLLDRVTCAWPSRFEDRNGGYQALYRTSNELTALYRKHGFELVSQHRSHVPFRWPVRARGPLTERALLGLLRKAPRVGCAFIACMSRFWQFVRPLQKARRVKLSHDFFVFKKFGAKTPQG